MDYSGKIRLKDIPLADKNMKIIFNGLKNYSFLYHSFHGSINPNNFLNFSVNIKSRELIKY